MTEKYSPGPHFSPEERDAWAKKEKELTIKEAEMLKAGGEYHVGVDGAVSFQFSDEQIAERNEELKEEMIRRFLLTPEQAFTLDGIEAGSDLAEILTRLIPKNFKLYLNKIEIAPDGTYTFTPSEDALETAHLMLPPTEVPAGKSLERNQKSEYPAIHINSELSLEDAIAQAQIVETHKNISRFPFEKSEGGEFVPVLVRFGVSKSWSEAEDELEHMGLRSATLRELLAFAATYPDDPNLAINVCAPGAKSTFELNEHVPHVRLISKEETPFKKYKYLGIDTIYNNDIAFRSSFIALCTYK